MWRDLGSLSVDAGLGSRVIAGVTDEIGDRDLTELVRQRDEAYSSKLPEAEGGSTANRARATSSASKKRNQKR